MAGSLARFLPRVFHPGVHTAVAVAAVTAFVSVQFGSSTGFMPASTSFRFRKLPSVLRSLPWRTSLAASASEVPHSERRALHAGPKGTKISSGVKSHFSAHRDLAEALHRPGIVPRSMMAWRSHGRSNAELVENLRRNGVFKDEKVYEAMRKVDRGYFVSMDPYDDSPQPIGFDATISAPHMHAIALEHLKDQLIPGHRALDVGSGTGYLTVCMALMVGVGQEGGGKTVGIDHIQGLVDLSRKNVEASFSWLLKSPDFMLIKGNGWAGGPASAAPYHAIHVGAAAQSVPAALVQQLARGGKMIIPVECRRGSPEMDLYHGLHRTPETAGCSGACWFGGNSPPKWLVEELQATLGCSVPLQPRMQIMPFGTPQRV